MTKMTVAEKPKPNGVSSDPRQCSSKEGSFRRLFTYPLVRRCDMNDAMREETLKIISKSCETNSDNNEMAAKLIKEVMDDQYGESWHVVVGEEFGLELSYDAETLLYMFYGANLAICVWRCSG